ncbi:hypothetical protein [Pseudarthrobacter siccitolerans]|uniref:hypothetical protein n=1 Tax=Pseudarthrobacter siccitolerans TaxID=861266 RepID=UPI0027B89CB5|nr:hypothetical protein [Pseudarthrobacter siccitolerans]
MELLLLGLKRVSLNVELIFLGVELTVLRCELFSLLIQGALLDHKAESADDESQR